MLMLRWWIVILVVANLLVFVAVRGLSGLTPAAGNLEPWHLDGQIHPEILLVRPATPAEINDGAVTGPPVTAPAISASSLAH
jgi:hypothetical protein